MLLVGPWRRLPLTIRWLNQEYQLDFPHDRQPPVHMPIAYGQVEVTKKKGSRERQQRAVGVESGEEEEGEGEGGERVEDGSLQSSQSCYICHQVTKRPI